MNSSKVKSFLIILLAAVNIFLLVSLIMTKSASSRLSDDFLNASVQALENREIYVEPDIIPAQKYTQSVITADRSEETHIALAQSMLGEIVAEYDLPNGTTHQSDKAYVSFFDDGRFEYGLLDDKETQELVSVVSPDMLVTMDTATSNNLKKSFDKITARRTADKLSYKALGQVELNGKTLVYARLIANKLSLFDGNFVMVFDKNELAYLSGKFFFDVFGASYAMEYIDAPNALFLIKDKDVTVSDVQMVYYPAATGENEYFLIPSWQITLDDGTVKIFDGVSGYERQ